MNNLEILFPKLKPLAILRSWGPFILTVVLLLTSCNKYGPLPGISSLQSQSPTSIAEPIAEKAAIEEPISLAIQTLPQVNTYEKIKDPPAKFVFPTPAPPPKSVWRPPLYPVPWGLRDYDHFFFIRPIPVDDVNWPLANYRYGGIFFEDVVHTGVDITSPTGTPVLATGPGKVVWSGYGLLSFSPNNYDDPYGLAIAIRHDFGYQDQPLYTLYAHLSESFVIEDQVVEAGEVIGLSGETGQTTGPHLHYEVRIGRNDYFSTQNPELWLAPPQGWGILAGRVMSTSGNLISHKDITVTAVENYRVWLVMTYGPKSVNSDPYYRENVVMGDLPAGIYQLAINYEGKNYLKNIEISPGSISYFTFKGSEGFSLNPPATPTVETNFLDP